MSGPAYVDVRMQELGNGLARTIYLPTCDVHVGPPWRGAPSADRELATFNAGIHNTDMHRAEDGMLAGLEPEDLAELAFAQATEPTAHISRTNNPITKD